MTHDNIKIAQQFTECFRAGDIDGVLALLSPDVVFHEPTDLPYGRDFHGREGFLELAGAVGSKYRLDVVSDEYHDIAGRVLSMLQLQITALENGKSTLMPVLEVYTIIGGKIVDADIYFKNPHVMHELVSG